MGYFASIQTRVINVVVLSYPAKFHLIYLMYSRIPLSSLINEHFRNLANKFPMLKFVKSLAGLCIANYPDQNLPTIFVYHNGDLKHQLIGANCFASGIKQDGTMLCRRTQMLMGY